MPLFQYGTHYPNGFQAFSWVTSLDFGTYRPIQKIEYIWNYYDHPTPLPPNHPYDKDSLIRYADGSNFTTCRDANAHLLFDFNLDGELDVEYPPDGAFAFMEHSGRGVNNELRGNPFSNFWFDDNSLAKYMTLTYMDAVPSGLHEYDDFTRWRIIGGNYTNWTPYPNPSNYNDQLALNGLFYLATNQETSAMTCWKKILQNSHAVYNSTFQRYDYPGITESYHLSLWLILSSFLHEVSPQDDTVLQHYISVRSNLLSAQIADASTTLAAGPFYGWTSDIHGGTSLMNTESVSCGVLGLGANALKTFEFGRDPLKSDSATANYFLRPHNVLSAVQGLSLSGYLSYGQLGFSGTSYLFEFFHRSGSLTSSSHSLDQVLLTVDLFDSQSAIVLTEKNITGRDFSLDNQWKATTISFSSPQSVESMEFRVWYHGVENIDVSHLRAKSGK